MKPYTRQGQVRKQPAKTYRLHKAIGNNLKELGYDAR